MLTAFELQKFLRRYEPLKHVMVSERSGMVYAPSLVKVHGMINVYGEHHVFETELDLVEIGGIEDMELLAKQLLKSFAAAAQMMSANSE
jgi:hypothetical protein